jgi:hypothetical protein
MYHSSPYLFVLFFLASDSYMIAHPFHYYEPHFLLVSIRAILCHFVFYTNQNGSFSSGMVLSTMGTWEMSDWLLDGGIWGGLEAKLMFRRSPDTNNFVLTLSWLVNQHLTDLLRMLLRRYHYSCQCRCRGASLSPPSTCSCVWFVYRWGRNYIC